MLVLKYWATGILIKLGMETGSLTKRQQTDKKQKATRTNSSRTDVSTQW